MPTDLRSTVLLRSEDSSGHLSVVENVVPARSAGPPLHSHDFDEAFYVLDGELVFRVGEALLARTAGQLAFAPRGAAHALTNRRNAPARYLLVCTPAGFERHFARTAAQAEGTEPPPWALQPVPEVVPLGPPILQEVLDRLGERARGTTR
jgi:quercetin dioxygenase-like cupin family protein